MTNGKFDESAFWEIFEIVCTKLWGEKYRLRKIQMTSKLSHKPWNKPHLHSREWLRNNKTEKQIHMQWIFLISCTTEDLGWKESGLRTKRGKKGGVYLVENARWIFAKCGIYLHLLVFSDRKIQGFSIVLLSVNLSIRSIIRYFPITVIPENACFLELSGLLTLGEWLVCLCSQMFSRCKTSRSPGVYNWKPAFSLVFQCSPFDELLGNIVSFCVCKNFLVFSGTASSGESK